MSPFIKEKLINEEQNRKKAIKEGKDKNLIKNDTKSNNIVKTYINIYNPIKTNINNNNYNINNIVDQRRKNTYEINKFLKSSNWKIQEEFSDRNIFKNLKLNHFINDIKSFMKKRDIFIQGITKLK